MEVNYLCKTNHLKSFIDFKIKQRLKKSEHLVFPKCSKRFIFQNCNPAGRNKRIIKEEPKNQNCTAEIFLRLFFLFSSPPQLQSSYPSLALYLFANKNDCREFLLVVAWTMNGKGYFQTFSLFLLISALFVLPRFIYQRKRLHIIKQGGGGIFQQMNKRTALLLPSNERSTKHHPKKRGNALIV